MKLISSILILIILLVFLPVDTNSQSLDSARFTNSFWKYSKWVSLTLTAAMGSFYMIQKENNKPTDQFLAATVTSGGLTALAFIMDAFTDEEKERELQRQSDPLKKEEKKENKVIASTISEIVILDPLPDDKNRIITNKRKIKISGIIKGGAYQELYLNNRSISLNADGAFSVDFTLNEDINLANFKLKSDNNSIEKNLIVNYKQESLERKGADYALLFASDNYDHWNVLSNPINDLNTIENELRSNYNFKTEKYINSLKADIYTALRKYAQMQFNDEDQLFIFFAGHGKFDEVFKEGFLVTKDSKRDDENNDSYISHAILKQRIDNIPCKHVFLVIDACFGGALDPTIAGSSERGDNLYSEITKPEFIKRKLKFKTRKYLTSGGKEYVPDGRPGEHSPFARKLLEALRTYGGSDGILTLSKINNYIEKVKPEPRFGSFGSDEPGSDFIFIAK